MVSIFGKLFSGASPSSANPLEAETRAMNAYKMQAMEEATRAAAAQNRAATFGDYLTAAQRLGETKGDEMRAHGIQWNANSYSALDGQRISSMLIRREDIEPPSATLLKMAVISATRKARDAGRERATPSEVMQAVVDIKQSGTPQTAQGIEGMENFLDLDMDNTVSDLYRSANAHASFHNTVFDNCSFHPAGTLMYDKVEGAEGHTQITAITDGATFTNCVFDEMAPTDTVTLRPGKYNNITIINPNGGTLEFGSGAHSNGVTLGTDDGKNPRTGNLEHGDIKLKIEERASLSSLKVNAGVRVLAFDIQPGGMLANSTINGATVHMDSKLTGAVLTNVTFTNVNMGYVDLSGAKLNKVEFTGSQLNGMNLSGAKIADMRVDGKLITSKEQLQALGATFNPGAEPRVIASPEALKADAASKLTNVTQTALDWNRQIKEQAPVAGAQPQQPTNGLVNADGTLSSAGQAIHHDAHQKRQQLPNQPAEAGVKPLSASTDPALAPRMAPPRPAQPALSPEAQKVFGGRQRSLAELPPLPNLKKEG